MPYIYNLEFLGNKRFPTPITNRRSYFIPSFNYNIVGRNTRLFSRFFFQENNGDEFNTDDVQPESRWVLTYLTKWEGIFTWK